MVPQQIPFYSSGAPPGYGQPGFYASNPAPQVQGLPVQVGIPAGVPVFGSTVQQPFANAGIGNVPFSSNQQTHYVQGQQNNFGQGVRSNNAYTAPSNGNSWQGQPRAPSSPPPSSFPPGFEPGHNNNLAMGVPSQPRPEAVAMGGAVVHPNQHHAHYQHQHEHQLQQQYQHQQQQQQHQNQYQHQHHQNHQQLEQHQHLYHHQHQHQNLHSNQHQRQHQVQQQDYQQNQHSYVHSQHQMQAQPHHPQLQIQTQPHPVQLQTRPQPQHQPQLQTPPQPVQVHAGSHSQAQLACQQVQLIPAPFSNSLHAYPSNIQTDCANGVAIGLPVMSTSSHVDTSASQTVAQIQQPAPAWQPGYTENLLQCAPQDKGPQTFAPKKDHHSNARQPTSIQRNDYSNIERQTDPSRGHAQAMPQMKSDSQLRVEAMKPSDAHLSDQMRSSGHLASGASQPSFFIGNNRQHWLSPPNSQMPAWANGRNPPQILRGFQPHNNNGELKSPMNVPVSVAAQNGQRLSQLQRQCDSRGKIFNKDMQQRSGMKLIRCDPCDRTFTCSEILGTHLKTHVKCGEEGCTFEASGKIVKEHKVTEHGKVDIQPTYRGRKALALRSMEDQEDIKRWREERKKSYPTSANIQRKAEDRKRMEAEGELLDEESQKRCQRMRDVIATQKQLGYQVPEIPSHYFHTRLDRRPKKMVREEAAIAYATGGKTDFVERRSSVGLKRTADVMETSHDRAVRVDNLKNGSQTMEPINDDREYQKRGRGRKGYQSKFMSRHDGRKHNQNYDIKTAWPRPPTLLSKLLHDDIQKESSYLLQCCRFIVNNAFLQDYSPTSLKHFEWIVAALPGIGDELPANVMDSKARLKKGEEVPTLSNSETSACGNESTTLLDSKESILEAEKKVIDMEDTGFVICKPHSLNNKNLVADGETEDAPHAPVTFPHKFERKNEEQDLVCEEPPQTNLSQPCYRNGGKLELKVDTTAQNLSVDCQTRCGKHPDACLESNNSQLSHFAMHKVASRVHTSVPSWKPTSTSTDLSYDDMEAGEVVSGHSESIVEDEEDISQYMNFDANGADSGSCYD